MPHSRLADRLAVQSPDVVLNAIFEELEGGQLPAANTADARRIALILEARVLLFREKERIQTLEARANQRPSAPLTPLEDVDLAVLRLQAQLLAVELRERFPKQRNEAAGATYFAPNKRSNPSERTLELKKTDSVNLVRVFQDVLARLRSRPSRKNERQSQ